MKTTVVIETLYAHFENMHTFVRKKLENVLEFNFLLARRYKHRINLLLPVSVL